MLTKPIRIVVAISQTLFREGIVSLFKEHPEFDVLCEAVTGPEAVERAAELIPDVIVLDTKLALLDGISAARRIHAFGDRTEIVFISANHNDDEVREAFEAGARGYLLKDCEFEELMFAVKKAANGDYYVSGPASQDMVAEYVKPLLTSQRPGGVMTQRERELARLLADGYSSKEAADVLNISTKTVEAHRASIMKKLNARNVTDIVKYCIRNHIIEA